MSSQQENKPPASKLSIADKCAVTFNGHRLDELIMEMDNLSDTVSRIVGAKTGKATKAPKAPKKEIAGEKKDAGKKEPLKKAAAPPVGTAPKGETKQEPEAGAAPPEAKTAQKPPAAKKTKAKQKADDAYRAPASEPGTNPFANQVAPKQ